MARFNFPIPGRRQKQTAAAPPRNKAQKLLGNDYSVDSRLSVPVDTSRNWETRSSSGMSISISESTVSEEDYHDHHDHDHHDHHDASGLSSLPEGEVVNATTPRQQLFEEESGVLGHADFHAESPSGYDRHSVTDASSLRRRLSSSTIMSFYDKSKVPLVISQQTSNSAMAKGLPQKAQSLLDMDGAISKGNGSKKKKPARLDFSHLIPARRSSMAATSAATSRNNNRLVLGPDLVTRSPSVMSASPLEQSAPPASRSRGDKKTLQTSKRASSIHSKSAGNLSSVPVQPPTQLVPPAENPHGLQNLYDHYERMSIRDVVLEEEDEHEPVQPAKNSPESDFNPYARQAAHAALVRNEIPTHSGSQINLLGYGLHSPSTDCSSASISSKHTRTSRASRRSLMEVDLQQTSILSLSSDSDEEEFANAPQPVAAAYSPQMTSEDSQSTGTRPNSFYAVQATASNHSGYYGQGETSEPETVTMAFGFPQPSTRFSNASLATNSTARPSTKLYRSSSRTSRRSLHSNHTMQSFGSYAVQDARNGASDFYEAYDGNSLEQSTPPLSPTSIDSYYARARHAGEVDQRSVRSGRSLGSLGSLSTAASSRSTASPKSQSRYMAVTRQEEKLLAALRMKKARMRESIIAEFEEEQEKSTDFTANSGHHVKTSPHSHRAASNGTPELYAPMPQSANRTSINFPLQITDGPVSPGLPTARTLQRRNTHSRHASSVRSYDPSAYGEGSSGLPSPALQASFNQGKHRRQTSRQSAAVIDQYDDDYYSAEPSPDLSDFLDFDDGNSGRSSDSIRFRPSTAPSPVNQASSNRHSSQFLQPPAAKKRGGSSGHHSHKSRSKRMSRNLDDDVQVHIVDDLPLDHGSGANMVDDDMPGIPRPDSPIDAPLPLPRKKAVRISAVGPVGMEAGWWGHDG